MDYILIGLGVILLLLGIAGAILPVLPGPPLNYLALLLLHATTSHQFTSQFLLIWAIITIVVLRAGLYNSCLGHQKIRGQQARHLGQYGWATAWADLFSPFGHYYWTICRGHCRRTTKRQKFNRSVAGWIWFVCWLFGRHLAKTYCFGHDDLVFFQGTNRLSSKENRSHIPFSS